MNTLNRRDYTDTPDHDDACMVCDKIDCIFEAEGEPLGTGGNDTLVQGERDHASLTAGATPAAFDLDAEIERQRAAGYETFDDYITRTGFPRDEASYAAWIGEGRWMLTSRDKPITPSFRDYEPEQAYGTHHDFQEHRRFGGTREDY